MGYLIIPFFNTVNKIGLNLDFKVENHCLDYLQQSSLLLNCILKCFLLEIKDLCVDCESSMRCFTSKKYHTLSYIEY